jgi:uncharacterized membrane protein YphA (DoxX/SURF4 family)
MSSQSQTRSTWSLVGIWALQIVVGLMLFASGAAKLGGAESMVTLFDNIGVGQWFRYVTGLVEVLGGAMTLYPKTAWVGAGLLACTMVGAVLTHLFIIGGSFVVPLVLLVLAALVVWFRLPR